MVKADIATRDTAMKGIITDEFTDSFRLAESIAGRLPVTGDTGAWFDHDGPSANRYLSQPDTTPRRRNDRMSWTRS